MTTRKLSCGHEAPRLRYSPPGSVCERCELEQVVVGKREQPAPLDRKQSPAEPQAHGALRTSRAHLSISARMVLAAIAAGPCTSEELGRRCHLPPAVVDTALAELRSAGRAVEEKPRRWRAL